MAVVIFWGIIIIALLSFTVAQFFNVMVRGLPPFLPTKDSIIEKAGEALNLDKKDVVYELGCGRAKFLRSLEKRFPSARYIGVEYSFLPYLLARLQFLLTGSKIKINKINFFKVDLSDATLIYCYLLPETMVKLKNKILSECRKGTMIISYQFSLPDWLPEKTIIDGQSRLYFYKL